MQGGAPPCDPASAFYRQKAERKAVLRGSVPLRLPQTVPAESCFSINGSTLIFYFGTKSEVSRATIESTT